GEAAGLPAGIYKVRLVLAPDGGITIESNPIPERLPTARLAISALRVDPADRFLFHKTTHRPVQQSALAECPDCDDVILLNDKDELTETSQANLVLDIDGELLTPALECGLLPGVMRERLLAEGRISE